MYLPTGHWQHHSQADHGPFLLTVGAEIPWRLRWNISARNTRPCRNSWPRWSAVVPSRCCAGSSSSRRCCASESSSDPRMEMGFCLSFCWSEWAYQCLVHRETCHFLYTSYISYKSYISQPFVLPVLVRAKVCVWCVSMLLLLPLCFCRRAVKVL